MTVKEIDGKWHTVNKAGKVGKRAFKSRESAEAASARGKALLGGPSPSSSTSSPSGLDDMDTAEERRALGIPPKHVAKDPEAF